MYNKWIELTKLQATGHIYSYIVRHQRHKIMHLWCDLRKPFTWCKIDVFSYWYHVKVNFEFLFSKPFTWIFRNTGTKIYWCSKAINKDKHKNYVVNFLYYAVSPCATCEGFSQNASHSLMPCTWTLWIDRGFLITVLELGFLFLFLFVCLFVCLF